MKMEIISKISISEALFIYLSTTAMLWLFSFSNWKVPFTCWSSLYKISKSNWVVLNYITFWQHSLFKCFKEIDEYTLFFKTSSYTNLQSDRQHEWLAQWTPQPIRRSVIIILLYLFLLPFCLPIHMHMDVIVCVGIHVCIYILYIYKYYFKITWRHYDSFHLKYYGVYSMKIRIYPINILSICLFNLLI